MPGTTDSNLYPANGAPINDHLSFGKLAVSTSTIPKLLFEVSFINCPPCFTIIIRLFSKDVKSDSVAIVLVLPAGTK